MTPRRPAGPVGPAHEGPRWPSCAEFLRTRLPATASDATMPEARSGRRMARTYQTSESGPLVISGDSCWPLARWVPPGVGVPMVAAAGPPASPKQVRPGGLLRTRLRARAPTPPSRSARARLSARVVRRRGTARGPASGLAGIAGLPAAAPRRRRRESLTRRARPASPDGWRAPRRRFASQEGGRPGSWPSLP